MPGLRDRNLRSGDFQEDLGVLLLKGIAVVASIPRTEDVGADAFATLLRPESPRRLVAEESFLLQIKASSVRCLEYTAPHALEWLTQLEIPFFIASVNKGKGSVSLYPTHRLSWVMLEGKWQGIVFHLDTLDENAGPPGTRHIHLGEPALTWSLSDLNRPEFGEQAYAIMKKHIAAQRYNLQFTSLGYLEPVSWQTNSIPLHGGAVMMNSAIPADENAMLKPMIPPLRALITQIIARQRYRDLPAVMAFVDMMRKRGLDPDPEGVWCRMALLSAEGEEISEEEMIYLRSLGIPGQLDLKGTCISDCGLLHIPAWVEKLSLARTRISDAGVQHLTLLQNLRRLDLSSTGVTVASVKALGMLSQLEWLNLSDTQVTHKGIERLRRLLPCANIIA